VNVLGNQLFRSAITTPKITNNIVKSEGFRDISDGVVEYGLDLLAL
jgi:hypothetical protein